MYAPGSGIWGTPTASVDWCEANYEHTRYVCEFYNTLSSTALIAAGALGLWLHRRTLERRFLLAFSALVIVGAGSIAFHATLRFECQMLDELPMLYTVLVMLYILFENRRERRFGRWFPAVLVALGIVLSSLSAFTRGAVQANVFRISFTALEFYSLYLVYRIQRSSDNPLVRTLFRVGIASYACAIGCWTVDLEGCAWVGGVLPAHGIPNPQLHAWWHVLVSNGLYLLTLMLAGHRLDVLGQRGELRFAGGAIPYLAIAPHPIPVPARARA